VGSLPANSQPWFGSTASTMSERGMRTTSWRCEGHPCGSLMELAGTYRFSSSVTTREEDARSVAAQGWGV
jgi:hypothetical protein